MKVQIARFTAHQNAKVFGVLFALSSLVFLIPFTLFAFAAAPSDQTPPLFVMLLLPLVYLVFGYLSVAIGCWLYNAMVPHLGGIEFEQRPVE